MSLRIAIIGTRGIPANYGGFETFAEEISKEFIQKGHNVTVYSRKKFFTKAAKEDYLGIKTVKTATIFHKYLETPLNALTAYVHALRCNYDVVLICNAANSPFSWILKLAKIPFVINVDGIERKRSKWNLAGKLWYLLGEQCSVYFANRIISDAHIIQDYYRQRYGTDSVVIRYGARVNKIQAGKVLKDFGLKSEKYILYVSRLEPENNALGVIQAYNQIATEIPLVIVGDAPYAKDYIDALNKEAQQGNNQIIFTGYQFGASYKELRTNCLFYIQATEVGGTHPALVEAIAYGNCVVANDVPEHREVLHDAGLYYNLNDFNQLAGVMQELLSDNNQILHYRQAATELASAEYEWSKIAEQYLELFAELA